MSEQGEKTFKTIKDVILLVIATISISFAVVKNGEAKQIETVEEIV